MSAGFAVSNLLIASLNGITTATGVTIGKSLGGNQLDQARQEKVWMLSAAVVLGGFMCLAGFGSVALVPIVFGSCKIVEYV